jgi:hypothetical protein
VTNTDLLGQVLVDPAIHLTARQRYALEVIADLQPVTSDELGAHLCSRRGKHTTDRRCEYDAVNGREVARALRRKGLVRERRGEGWYSTSTPRCRSDLDLGPGELPEGF